MNTKFIVMQEINVEIGNGANGLEIHNIMGVYNSNPEAEKAIKDFKKKEDKKAILKEYKDQYSNLSKDVEIDYVVYEFKGSPLNTFEGAVNYDL